MKKEFDNTLSKKLTKITNFELSCKLTKFFGLIINQKNEKSKFKLMNMLSKIFDHIPYIRFVEMELKMHKNSVTNVEYWLPKLLNCNILMPETQLITLTKEEIAELINATLKKVELTKKSTIYVKLKEGIETLGGYPIFIRGSTISMKFFWANTCYVENESILLRNINNINYWHIKRSIDQTGKIDRNPPFTPSFVLRKIIPTNTDLSAYDNMPCPKERRYFVKNGKVICKHPYWVMETFKGKNIPDLKKRLDKLNFMDSEEINHLTEMAEKISREFKGSWSIDFMQGSNNKWYVIDMVPAVVSYHHEPCKHKDDFGYDKEEFSPYKI